MADEEKKKEQLSDDAFINEAGEGFDEMNQSDFQMPMLNILQAGSPELLEGNEKYNEAARPGRIYNTSSRQIYKEVTVLPVRFKPKFVEWKPRNQGGGFVAHYETQPDDMYQDPMTGFMHRKSTGNDILQTNYYLCLLQEEGWDRVIIAMKSTQLKKARMWNTLMFAQKGKTPDGKSFSLPTFSTYYKLGVVQENNAKGNWFGWSIKLTGRIDNLALYNYAKETFQTQIDFLPQRLITVRDDDDNGNKGGNNGTGGDEVL